MSMRILTAFRYRYKPTRIHNLDPRTKLYITSLISIVTLFFVEPLPLLITFGVVGALMASANCLNEWFTTLKGLKGLLFFILILNYLLNSLSFAVSMVFRLITLSSAFSIYFLTVHPDDLAQSMIQMRLPFELAFAMSMATRFVPTLAVEAETIMDAQKSRGLELEKGGTLDRVKNLIPILIPLIVSSIRRALTVAESIESRGFGSQTKRTFYYVLEMRRLDYIAIGLATIAVGAVISARATGALSLLFPWLYWSLPF